MSREAFLPCFMCGGRLLNAFPDSENQPQEGTEFRTYGNYGSTFWDSFDGEELVLNICDDCLTKGKDRLAQHKRYRPIRCNGLSGMGRHWVDRPMVSYTGNPDDGSLIVEPEELGTALPSVEWPDDIAERKAAILEQEEVEEVKRALVSDKTIADVARLNNEALVDLPDAEVVQLVAEGRATYWTPGA